MSRDPAQPWPEPPPPWVVGSQLDTRSIYPPFSHAHAHAHAVPAGKVEVRNEHNGELIYKEYFDAPIAAIVQADYRAPPSLLILQGITLLPF